MSEIEKCWKPNHFLFGFLNPTFGFQTFTVHSLMLWPQIWTYTKSLLNESGFWNPLFINKGWWILLNFYLLKDLLKNWEENRLEVGDRFGSRIADDANGQAQWLELKENNKKLFLGTEKNYLGFQNEFSGKINKHGMSRENVAIGHFQNYEILDLLILYFWYIDC